MGGSDSSDHCRPYFFGGNMAENKEYVEVTKVIDGTPFIVRVHFNQDGKMTIEDRIRRMVLNDYMGRAGGNKLIDRID